MHAMINFTINLPTQHVQDLSSIRDMQTAKNAAASAKETSANAAASAKAGMEKTKAAAQEKMERMMSHDPAQKDVATQKKDDKIRQAEINKREAIEQHAAQRQAAAVPGAGGVAQTHGATHHDVGGTGTAPGGTYR